MVNINRDDGMRLHYLDNLRIFCMLFGVYYHAAAMSQFGWIEYASMLSPFFRMEAFFFASGYFGAMLLERRNVPKFLRHRTIGLARPFLSTLLLINPVIIYLKYGFFENIPYGTYTFKEALQSIFDSTWDGPELHLWFLLVLLLYVFLLPLLINLIKSIAPSLENISLVSLTIGFAFLYTIYMLAYVVLSRSVPLPRLTTPVVSHFPFYFVGAMAYHCIALRNAMRTPNIILLIIAVFAVLVTQTYRGPGWGPAGDLSRSFITVTLVIMVNWFFWKFASESNFITRALSSSIYTVYLVHPLILFLSAGVLGAYFGDLSAIHLITYTSSTILLGIIIHVAVIDRVALLRLLFNGKRD